MCGKVYGARTHHDHKFTNCESFSSVRERKRNRRLELVNILLNRPLLLLPSHRDADVTDTSHLHKPPVAICHKPGADENKSNYTVAPRCTMAWQALTTLRNTVSNITDF